MSTIKPIKTIQDIQIGKVKLITKFSILGSIIFLYIGVTFICTIVQIILFSFYDLDNKMPKVRKELAEK